MGCGLRSCLNHCLKSAKQPISGPAAQRAWSSGDGQPRAERALPEPITVSRRSLRARPSGPGLPARGTTSPRRWAGRACRPGRSRSPWWSMIRTLPGAPTCTGCSSASTRPAPSWSRARCRRAPDRSTTAPARPPTPAHVLRRITSPLPVHHLRPRAQGGVGGDASPEAAIAAIEAVATARGRLVGTFGR